MKSVVICELPFDETVEMLTSEKRESVCFLDGLLRSWNSIGDCLRGYVVDLGAVS